MADGYLLDEDVHPDAAVAARALDLDVVSVYEIGRRGVEFPDESQLRYAASERRMLVTRNRDDFIRLTREFFRTGEPHFGVLILPHTIPNREPGRIARALAARNASLEPGIEERYVIDFLSG